MFAKNTCLPDNVPKAKSRVAYIGDMQRTDMILYELGPSTKVPSIPVMLVMAGRTNATEVDPVTPNTIIATTASFESSFQFGRDCVVQFQNFDFADEHSRHF